MKILIVGSDKVFAIENFYVKYLREFGVTVTLFTAQNIFYDYYQKNAINKIIFRLGLSGVIRKINRLFVDLAENEQPDIIWVFKGMEILPQSLEWAKTKNIKLVNYNPDSPFFFSGRGSGNANVTHSIDLYDLHFTYSLEIQKQLIQNKAARTQMLPFGFDIEDSVVKECSEQTELNEVCFLGNPDVDRATFIRLLAENGIAVSVYGNNWSRFISHPLVKSFDPVYSVEQWKVLRKYRIQLNLMRKHNENAHNMRTFEVPGVGGIMLAPDTPEHRVFFENGTEVFLFKNVMDCVGLINKILNFTLEEALGVRNAARTRSLNSKYTYEDRARQALREFERLVI